MFVVPVVSFDVEVPLAVFLPCQLSDFVRMLPTSIPGFRVEVVIAFFSRVVRGKSRHSIPHCYF